jgi:hypothetical protein
MKTFFIDDNYITILEDGDASVNISQDMFGYFIRATS